MPGSFSIRQAAENDYPFMREILYAAIFIPEGGEKPPFAVIDDPAIYKYIGDWMNDTDCGFIAEVGSRSIGAAWSRLFENAEAGGYGFIDSSTPELGLAVLEDYRGEGIGTALMHTLMAELKTRGYERLSLSVDKLNRAVGLYKKLGFRIVKEQETDFLMVKRL